MPHFPKPFFRPKRNLWYVQLGGRQINLGSDRDAAFRRYHELMAAPREETPPRLVPADVLGVLDQFLAWTQLHRAGRTYETYVERLQSFTDWLAARNLTALTVGELRPLHVQQWVDSHANWKPGMKRGRMQSVQRALNWAVKQGVIDGSPLRGLEKPPPGRRENAIDEAQFRKLYAAAGPAFRAVLLTCWEVGCRPQEVVRVCARHLDRGRWVFPAGESKGKRKIRVVYLTPAIRELCERLAQDAGDGPLFRNSDGLPWNKQSINCAVCRAAKRTGIKIALVDLRHSFCTRSLAAGVDPVTLSELMGHVDTSTLSKVYAHVGRDPEHLTKALGRANAPRGDAA